MTRPLPPGPDIETYRAEARGADAELAVAREHGFESWAIFAEHVAALATDSPVARFEAAVEAVIAGDLVALDRLLAADAQLVRARSTRRHGATLLHYVGANGVEDYRQKTPPNAVAVARRLLDAGADIDAIASSYGGSNALGLVATSIHPVIAGVQDELLELLLELGAAIDMPGNPGSAVNGCLRNGRGRAAALLARHGAHLDLEGAAGVGRLDVVRAALADAARAKVESGFAWACEYGRTEVVELLVAHGVDLAAKTVGATGLHWAAYAGHPEIVKLLLAHGAPTGLKDDRFDGTPLDWARHGAKEPPPEADQVNYAEVIALLE